MSSEGWHVQQGADLPGKEPGPCSLISEGELSGEGNMGDRKLVETEAHSGGVVVAARERGHAKQLEKPSPSRTRNRGREGKPYNRRNGKWAEDGRVAEGFAIVMIAGNAAGAKGPCYS